MIDLKFKYGTTNISEASNDPGAIYVQRTGNGKAKMYIDNPTITGSDRLQIDGNIFVGDPDAEGSGVENYDVIINPNGDIVNNVVTSEQAGGFVIRVVNPTNPDTYVPQDNPSSNMITLVI